MSISASPISITKTPADQQITDVSTSENDATGTPPPSGRVRPWAVVHACNFAREVADVVEAQLQVGMRPYLLMLYGSRTPVATEILGHRGTNGSPVSLLQGWQDVRRWRKQFDENGTYLHAELIHSHSFAAGMAAVRGGDALVYDVREWIEEQSQATSSWMARSFRTAEQFALARSSAVVVHSSAMRSECLLRGVAPEDVFVVHDPVLLPPSKKNSSPVNGFGVDLPGSRNGTVSVVARVCRPEGARETGNTAAKGSIGLENLLLAFSQALGENDAIRLVLVAPNDMLLSISQKARALDIRDKVVVAIEEDGDRAVASAEIAIADPVFMDDGVSRDGNVSLALAAMSQGTALLAADNASNRELSPEGRGLLWYSAEQKSVVRDLGHRLAFLARNSDFRRALGEGGQRYILQSRSPERIGALYDQVYRHAYSRCRKGDFPRDTSGALVSVQLCT